MADRISITEAMKLTGRTDKQIRDDITLGKLDAVKEEGGGKRARWMIDPASIQPDEPKPAASTDEQDLNLKDLKTAVEIKKIQQSLHEGRERIRAELESECTAAAFEILNRACRVIKKLGLTKKQQGIWNAEIDKIEKAHGK